VAVDSGGVAVVVSGAVVDDDVDDDEKEEDNGDWMVVVDNPSIWVCRNGPWGVDKAVRLLPTPGAVVDHLGTIVGPRTGLHRRDDAVVVVADHDADDDDAVGKDEEVDTGRRRPDRGDTEAVVDRVIPAATPHHHDDAGNHCRRGVVERLLVEKSVDHRRRARHGRESSQLGRMMRMDPWRCCWTFRHPRPVLFDHQSHCRTAAAAGSRCCQWWWWHQSQYCCSLVAKHPVVPPPHSY
jgi:hypothetical protein